MNVRQRLLLPVALWVTWSMSLARFGDSLWLDEGSSVWFARLPWQHLLTALCDPHPPGYYLLLKAWMSLGDSETWLRFPSLAASLLSVALLYRLGTHLWGPRGGRLAALLLALHPLQGWYAAEARMYIAAQALGLLVVWLGLQLLGSGKQDIDAHGCTQVQSSVHPRGRNRVFVKNPVSHRFHPPLAPALGPLLYWLAATLALWTDFSALAGFGVVQLLWIARGLPRARLWLALQAAVLLPYATLLSGSGQWQSLQNGYQAVFLSIQAANLGIYLPPPAAVRLLQAVVAGGMAVSLGLAWIWPRGLWQAHGRRPLQWAAVAGWLLLLALAATPRLFTVKRQLLVLLPYLALATAATLIRRPRRMAVTVAGLGLLTALVTLTTHGREPWRPVIAELHRQATGESAVLWVDELAAPVYDYYRRRADGTGLPTWVPLLGRALPELPETEPRPGGSLWLLTAESRYRHLVSLLPEGFFQRYRLLADRRGPGLALYRFERRAQPVMASSGWTAPTAVERWGLLLPSPLDTCGTE